MNLRCVKPLCLGPVSWMPAGAEGGGVLGGFRSKNSRHDWEESSENVGTCVQGVMRRGRRCGNCVSGPGGRDGGGCRASRGPASGRCGQPEGLTLTRIKGEVISPAGEAVGGG